MLDSSVHRRNFFMSQNPYQKEYSHEFEKFKNDFKKNLKPFFSLLILVIIIVGAMSSFYTVQPDEEAVAIRLGKYLETTQPGLHFKFPFGIDKVIKLQTKRIHQLEFGFRTRDTSAGRLRSSQRAYEDESLMLTGDLNVAVVEWVVQFQISDPYKYLFKTNDPILNIRDVSKSIMRRVVGDRLVTEVLTTGRTDIALNAKILMQDILDKYNLGVRIVTIKLQDVNPPERVKPSFNEVNAAKQEQEKVINQAEREYNNVIPEARGQAEKLVSEATGYATAVVNRAEGDAEKFLSIWREYKKAPVVTEKRMYLEAMEEIFTHVKSFTIVDSKIKGLLPVFQNLQKQSVEQ